MGKIEIIGRLMRRLKIEGKGYECNDVNLDKDFLIDFTENLLVKLEQRDNLIQYEKFFDDEIISKVKVHIFINEQKFNFTLSRDTFGDKILIGCKVYVENNDENLFGTAYSIKTKLIKIFNRYCENSNVFLLQDFNNEQISQAAYIEIHKIENRLRSILTRYLIKKYGKLLLSKSLKKEVDEYSKWFRKEVDGKYNTFKRINTDYANIDFLKLVKILELKDPSIIDENGNSVESKLSNIKELLGNDANVNDIFAQIRLIEEAVKNRKNVFDEKPSKEDEKDMINLFGTSSNLKYRDISVILDDEFKNYWKNELSKMRNIVAHNKPICKELYEDIINLCNWMHERFNECDAYIERSFYSDEEGVRSALEDMEIEKGRYEYDYIEEQRESFGIEFRLSEDYVENAIVESCTEIKNLICVINGLEDLGRLLDEIGSCLYEIENMGIGEKDLDLNDEIRKIVFEELKIEIDSDDNILDLDLFLEKHLFQDLKIQDAIQYYTENKNYLDANFDYFDMDFKVSWYDYSNIIYSITVDGELFPENGGTDEIKFILNINDEKHKAYYVQVNYGDYRDSSEGDINDSQIAMLVDEIESSVKTTIKFFTTLHKVAERIMKLFSNGGANEESTQD